MGNCLYDYLSESIVGACELMNFINSFLLWTAAGAALPVLIHMLNREKPKKVDIPTVEFIIKAVQKSSGSRKLNNFLLLLMRMLILVCLSLIVARPQIEKFLSSGTADNPVQAVIIIDNSYYSAHKNNSSTVIDEVKAKARSIVDTLPSGSLISIMSADENDNGFTAIKDYVYEKIDQLSPAPLNADMRSLITSASEMLNDLDAKAKNRIYLLSDMNRGSWNSNYDLNKLDPEIIYLSPLSKRVGNIFISDVKIKSSGFTKSQRIFKRRDTDIQVKISGDRVLAGLKVKLIIEGDEVDEKVILNEETDSELVFSTSFDKEGMYFCEVKIETQDSIETDNTYYFNIKVLPPLNIYLANDRKSLNPLIYRAALSPSGWHGKQKFNVNLLSYTKLLEKITVEKPDIIILCGSLSLTENQWQGVRSYIANGGKVILSPDQYTQFSELNKEIVPLIRSKVIPLDKKVKFASSSNEEWKDILNIPTLSEVLINHSYTLEQDPESENSTIPLRYNNGQACLSVHDIEQGKLAFWGVSPDLESSDFLNSDSFALLWHSLIEKLTDTETVKQNLFCGLPAEIFASAEETGKYQVQSPAGTTDQLSKESFTPYSHELFKSEYAQTYIPGHYYTSSTSFRGFSCNLERQPEFFNFPPKEEFAHLLTEKEEDKKSDLVKSTFGPDGLLIILIIVALLFMVIEIHLGNKNYYAGN
ncbi:MAG: BatA and WFA domain-containing protein [Lentisphaeraceae bacterium]|nr:BatA and WFA domain-containing protein [Lentisphaeraceae bacterium]